MDDFFDNIDNIEIEDNIKIEDNTVVSEYTRNYEFLISYNYQLLEKTNLNINQLLKIFEHNLDVVSLRNGDSIKYTIIECKTSYDVWNGQNTIIIRLYVHNKFDNIPDACSCLDAFYIFKNKPDLDKLETTVIFVDQYEKDVRYRMDIFRWNEFASGEYKNYSDFLRIIQKLIDSTEDFDEDDAAIDNYITNRYNIIPNNIIQNHVFLHNKIFNQNLHLGKLPDKLKAYKPLYHKRNEKPIVDPYSLEIFDSEFLTKHKIDIRKLLQLSSSDNFKISFSLSKRNNYTDNQNVYMWNGIDYDYQPVMKMFVDNYKQLIGQKPNDNIALNVLYSDCISCCFYLGNILSSENNTVYLVSVDFYGKQDYVVSILNQLFSLKS